MYGELIYTEHQLESISEYYLDSDEKRVTELKNLVNNRIRVYSYSLNEFKEVHKNSKVLESFNNLNDS
jgi:hypothetical protein